jgi:hypothetical protein
MTELILQDFRNLFSERLERVLSDEKQKMFGEQQSLWKDRRHKHLFLSSFADSFGSVRKRRGVPVVHWLTQGKERRGARNDGT